VVVAADRTGADLLVVPDQGQSHHETIEGTVSHPVHRTATADWSERHFQARVENNWEANAKDVAAAVAEQVKHCGAQLVVIAGDVRARHLIADALGPTPGVEVRLVEEGGRAAGSSAEALRTAVHDQVLRHVWRQRREVLEHLRQNLGRHEYAAAGLDAVVRALRMAQADTVVLSDDPSSTLVAWIGPGATDFGMDEAEAADLGVAEPRHDRFDAALVRAVVGTGARLLITPDAHDYLPDGIGALLRYDEPSRS
jgi:ribosomal protein L7Ae-like RNA K-turn-binding protein